jgi:hypothetical protein
MIVSEQKPFDEILQMMEGEGNIFIVGCNGCAESSGTGGKAQVAEMKNRLEQEGKEITGVVSVDFLCDKGLVKSRLARRAAQIAESDALFVMTCGIGVQATAAVVAKPVHPACNTISLGGSRGEWRGSERCRECGDCLLDLTGGLCPLTVCTKGLINGQCGGAKDGKCEFEPQTRDCGWQLIYERLKKLGRLDRMKTIVEPKDYSKMEVPEQIRSTTRWALEQREEEAVTK